jgi:hypothetical protein
MIKLKQLLQENNILIPRNIENREEQQKRIELQKIREYVKKGSKDSLDLSNSKLTKLPDELVKVGSVLDIKGSKIADLNNIRYISDYLMAYNSELKTLPDNFHCRGYVNCAESLINEIPNNLKIEGSLYLRDTPLSKKYTKEQIRKMIEDKGGYVGDVICGGNIML